jgi:hypothetical protein
LISGNRFLVVSVPLCLRGGCWERHARDYKKNMATKEHKVFPGPPSSQN